MKRQVTVETINLSTGYMSRRGTSIVTGGVTASLCSGELTCLLGPNGSGKSTLLKTLSAFLKPVDGEIMLLGKPLSGYSDAERARSIGVVLTDRVSPGNMTARELVGLGRTPYTGFWGRLSGGDKAIVDRAMALVGTGALADRPVDTLSDGERQKVMIAKALAQETPVILLDEPTAFLDYPSKVDIMRLLHALSRKSGKTVFMSTHDIELALQIADRVWLLDKTLDLATGTPEDLALDGRLARYFERDGVKFDVTTGLFGIDVKPVRKIRVTGSGNRRSMVCKALARNGIAAADSARELIEVTPVEFIFEGEAFGDIESLLSGITG